MTDELPEIPGYTVVDLLGSGGTGSVYVVHRGDGVRLAAKVVDGEVADLTAEAELLQSIEHDHVVRLVDSAVTADGRTVMITDLAAGGSLADCLAARGHLTPGELVTVLCPIARAMHDLHGLGLVHGDLSPGNILLTVAGKPMVADLGVARVGGYGTEDVWATEAWAAPEVMAGEAPTPASDVYSIGAIAWAALVGAPPEPAALRDPLSDLLPDLDAALVDLITACLAHTPSTRPEPGVVAIRLWESAIAEPAPVQGSPGRRGASTAPEELLTRRRRREEAAAAAAEEEAARMADRSGSGSLRAGRLVLVGAVAAIVVFAGALAARALSEPSGSGAAATQSVVSATTSVQEPPTPGTGARKPPTSAAKPTSSRVASGAAPTRPSAPLGGDPTVVIQALVDARAQTWTTGDLTALGRGLAPNSPAAQRDRADVSGAKAQGYGYRGLRFTVAGVRLTGVTADRVTARARLQRSAFTITGGGADRPVAASSTAVVLTLARTADGWRIWDWRTA
ncbi:protein kinase [Calidifontibacter sp. DB0510]|uniref:Protein kinase n=1 Tax=Metallococcus carri TaxID=1656884 RepID=A0A967AZH9_9MICO|nr:serine/threonine-protein kinase [Metallococcus carri]NHN55979.1 protein kinase [Metallococcus carri]NOP37564.1 protein kinase [Calidifontibacter sp. DB2511S]